MYLQLTKIRLKSYLTKKIVLKLQCRRNFNKAKWIIILRST